MDKEKRLNEDDRQVLHDLVDMMIDEGETFAYRSEVIDLGCWLNFKRIIWRISVSKNEETYGGFKDE